MDLNSAWIFVKVIQTGSFSAAARALNMPVSTVSTKVSQLEERLGVSLLRRTTRKLSLTEAGSRYFANAARACEALKEAEAVTSTGQDEARGLVRMTAPVEMGATTLTDAVSEFVTRFPKVQVELLLTDRMVDLVGEGIDLALRVGDLGDSSLHAKKIGTSGLHAYASPGYLKKSGEPKHPSELKDHECLGFMDGVSGEWEISQPGKSVRVTVRGSIAVNNLLALHRLAIQGRGIALLPDFLCAEDVGKGRLRHILKDWQAEHYPVQLVYPGQKYVPRPVRELIDYLAKNMQNVF